MAANNILANPMVIKGALATSYKTQLAAAVPNAGVNNTSYGTLQTLKIEKLRWDNPANVGDTISIGDPVSGLVLALLRCEVAGQRVELDWSANPRIWQDFEINAFPQGTLYVYTR